MINTVEKIFVNSFRNLTGNKVIVSENKNSAISLSLFFLLLSTALLSGCDMVSGSIKDYIQYNTGIPKASFIGVTSKNIIYKTKDAWMDYPVPGQDYIEFQVDVANPDNYDLIFTPVIYEYIDNLGNKVAAPEDKPVFVYTSQGNSLWIRIGNVAQGDSFRVRLDMATSDGTRIFEPYKDIPRMIYDTRLDPATDLTLNYSTSQATAAWSIPKDTDHKFITKMSLQFSSFNSSTIYGPWVYQKDPDSQVWTTTDLQALANGPLVTTSVDGASFSVNYPLGGNTLASEDDFHNNYNFTVVLEDKNGITSSASYGGINDMLQVGMTINYHITNMDGSVTTTPSGFSFEKLDRTNYKLIVPYDVNSLELLAVKTNDYQKINFNSSTTDSTIAEIGIPHIGTNIITMTVIWTDPLTNIQMTPVIYQFTAIRLSPSRDSTLKSLAVTGNVQTTAYDLAPVFKTPTLDADQNNVTTYYTVNVPSSVDTISISCEYLSTSAVYNDNGSVNGLPSGAPVVSNTYSDPNYLGALDNTKINTLNKSTLYEGNWCYNLDTDTCWNYNGTQWIDSGISYSGAFYNGYYYPDYTAEDNVIGINQIEIWKSFWNYPVSPGANLFYINVQPQADVSQTRTYTIMVIKATPNDNPLAKLATLSVKTQNGTTELLSPNFDQNILSYTVNAPYGSNQVTINAAAIDGARISEISNNDPNVSQPSYNPGQSVSDVLINGITANTQRIVTLKVNGGPEGSLPRNYLVQINGGIPTLASKPALTGGEKSLQVTWNNTLANGFTNVKAYEVWYSYATSSLPENAMKWGTDISAGSTGAALATTITGLSDYSHYYVWVRPKSDKDIPGDWVQAQTSSSMTDGIPGIAKMLDSSPYLPQFTVNPNTAVCTLSPQFNSSVTSYTLVIGSTVSSVNILYYYNNDPTPVSVNLTVPQAGGTSNYPITVYSPDGKNSINYTFTVKKMLSAPANVHLTAQTQSIGVTWDSVAGADYYEILYGTSSNKNSATTMVADPPPSAPAAVIPNLLNNTTTGYYVWVRGIRRSDLLPGDYSADQSPVTPNNGSIKITITVNNIPQEYNFLQPLPTAVQNLSWNANDKITATIDPGLNSYQWYIDGVLQTEIGNTLSRNAQQLSVAVHSVTVKVTSGGNVYSNTMEFKVNP